ncbi:MAG: hypothetical protein AAGF57_05235 [Pseudomonadota bacterium]
MVSFAQPGARLGKVVNLGVSQQRVSLYELFQRYVPVLSDLPGDRSQFDQTDLGCEWHCECDIGADPAAGGDLQIHFHLIDLDTLTRPAAVLYLIEHPLEKQQTRLPLPLENLTQTRDQLHDELAQCDAQAISFDKANAFVCALGRVKDRLRTEVTWV